jgi:uncharacterized protein (TIRG00374 family)
MSPAIKRSQRWRLIITAITFVALGILVYATREQIVDTFHNLRDVNSWALLLILPLQGLNYYAYANLYRSLLAILDTYMPFWPMYRISLELNFVNNVFPSAGVSSFSYYRTRMKPFGISTSKSTLVQLMRFTMVFISFQILLVVGLFLLALGGQANNLMILIAGSLVTCILIFTFTAAFIIGSKRRINTTFTMLTKAINRLIHIARPGHPETISIERVQGVFTELHENYMVIKNNLGELKRPLLFGLAANLTEILTIYAVYIAFGAWVNPGAVIIAYAIANFAGFISILPGGIGLYEAMTTAVLVAAGIPAGLGLSVTIMYRVLSMGLQLPPGWFLYYKFMHSKPAEAP